MICTQLSELRGRAGDADRGAWYMSSMRRRADIDRRDAEGVACDARLVW